MLNKYKKYIYMKFIEELLNLHQKAVIKKDNILNV